MVYGPPASSSLEGLGPPLFKNLILYELSMGLGVVVVEVLTRQARAGPGSRFTKSCCEQVRKPHGERSVLLGVFVLSI